TLGPVITKYDPDQSTLKELVPGDPGFGTKLQAKWGAGLMVGAGVKFQATRRIGLRFDVRGLWTERPHFNLPWTPGPSSFFIPQGGSELPVQLTAGIIFRFGLRGQTAPPLPTAVVKPQPEPVKEPPPAPKPIPEVPKPKPVEVRL